MIEAFFRKKSRIASIKFGPLGKFADGLAEKLVRNGYSTNMSQGILTRFGELSYYLHSRGVAPGMVNSSTIDDFLSERQSLITINGMENQLRHIVEYLVDMKVFPADCIPARNPVPHLPQDGILEEYARHQEAERGLSHSYVKSSRKAILLFLQDNFADYDDGCLSLIDGRMILEYYARHKDIVFNDISSLHGFVNFLSDRGLCAPVPDVAFPKYIRRRQLNPVKFIPEEDVKKALDSIDRFHPEGKRDFAALLVCADLGLRHQEVAGIQLDDIDWDHGIIRIRKTKVGRERDVKMSNDTREALIDYILNGRPFSDLPYVFLRHRAPGGRFTSQSLSGVVTRVLARAGVKRPFRVPNIFRPSLATYLVNHKVSLKIVSDMLDHRSADTTKHYLTVAFESMKDVIMPLPGGEK